MGHLTFIESVNIPRKMCHKSEISGGVGVGGAWAVWN